MSTVFCLLVVCICKILKTDIKDMVNYDEA